MKKIRKIWARGTSLFLMSIFILLFFNQHAVAYSDPSVTITPDHDQTIADQFTRHTVTGITTPLPVSPDVPGFIGASYVTIGDINKDGIKEIICTSGVGVDANQNTANGAVAIFTWNGVIWTVGQNQLSIIHSPFPMKQLYAIWTAMAIMISWFLIILSRAGQHVLSLVFIILKIKVKKILLRLQTGLKGQSSRVPRTFPMERIFLQWGNLHITGPSFSILMVMERKIS